MVIHVVQPGDTLYSIALDYDVPMSQIVLDNGLEAPERLVTGQALVIRFPETTHTVLAGENLTSIAREYGVSLRTLYQNNPALGGEPSVWPGQTLVISYREEPGPPISVNGYAYLLSASPSSKQPSPISPSLPPSLMALTRKAPWWTWTTRLFWPWPNPPEWPL